MSTLSNLVVALNAGKAHLKSLRSLFQLIRKCMCLWILSSAICEQIRITSFSYRLSDLFNFWPKLWKNFRYFLAITTGKNLSTLSRFISKLWKIASGENMSAKVNILLGPWLVKKSRNCNKKNQCWGTPWHFGADGISGSEPMANGSGSDSFLLWL